MDNSLIKRQDAIDAIESAKTARAPDGEIYVAKLNAEMNIQILPSAQPEPKKGKWVDFSMSIKGVPTEACSECGTWSLDMGKRFCPNCGAKMEVEHE